MTEDLRGLLREEVDAAAPLLAALVGPIEVAKSPTLKSKSGAAWIAKFAVNAVPVLLELAARRESSDAAGWAHLSDCGWSIAAEPVTLVLKDGTPPKDAKPKRAAS